MLRKSAEMLSSTHLSVVASGLEFIAEAITVVEDKQGIKDELTKISKMEILQTLRHSKSHEVCVGIM